MFELRSIAPRVVDQKKQE